MRAEHVEAAALASMVLGAPPVLARDLGLLLVADGDVIGAFAASLDVLALNRIMGLGVRQPATEAQLVRIVDVARARGVRRLFVQVAPQATPRGIVSWIGALGGRPHNRWVRLWRGTEPSIDAPTDLRIGEIGAADSLAFGYVVASGFGMPPALAATIAPWLAALPGRPGWRTLGAYDGDTLVAAASLHVGDGIGWLGMASTLPTHRGRGAQSALIAHRVAEARRLGCDHVVVETAEETAERPVVASYRNMVRLGFTVAYRRANHLIELRDGSGA